ncbi:MAG: DUF2304 domain-containing protein [Lacibacter sp.]
MTPIQFILISALLLTGLYFFVRIKSRIADVLLLLFFFCVATAFILFPDWSNIIAHKLGVGRGADLIFYLCIVLFVFVILKLYSRIRKLEQTLTDLLRKDAIEEADKTKNK